MWSSNLLAQPLVRLIAALLVTLAGSQFAGCGFQLRGAATFPFTSIHLLTGTPLLAELSRNIANGSNAKVVANIDDAQARFVLLGEAREKIILSLSTQGRVREFQLRYRVVYRVHDGKGGEFQRSSEIVLRRDISFNDDVLGKESEEELLFREMRADMVNQIIRRLQAAKLRQPDDD